jgi:beta-lactamase regulating signal transducer with metallopeptidase domain
VVAPSPIAFVAPADSARAVATVYTASLLVMVPVCVAAAAAFFLRQHSAEGRVLVWRSALVALLLVFIGRQLPLQWIAWAVPSGIATPLIALGRVQVTSAPGIEADGGTVVRLLFAVYLAGVAFVAASTLAGWLRMSRMARGGTPIRDPHWLRALDEAKRVAGIARRVRLVTTDELTVPVTWGMFRPVVAIPASATRWTDDGDRHRIVLLHELSHVASLDWAFNLIARIVCALFWFHPAAWWLARRLREDCELACDDRVIGAGVRRSDYAELLVDAADRLLPPSTALALSRRAGLRARLAAIIDGRHVAAPLGRRWIVAAALSTSVVVVPASAVRLAPSRAVLTTLIEDASWETRAYAVIGLARRADSVAVARSVAERDPNPRVRAWARYALEQRTDSSRVRAILLQ